MSHQAGDVVGDSRREGTATTAVIVEDIGELGSTEHYPRRMFGTATILSAVARAPDDDVAGTSERRGAAARNGAIVDPLTGAIGLRTKYTSKITDRSRVNMSCDTIHTGETMGRSLFSWGSKRRASV
ncbi:MAG: hypothetical protein Q8O67_20955 [Deltaproteobacteria bacterium]|nr:hypothetical protein [Deltaproteobacteria bacterium]